jgi:c-di-GMP-binding flagellar brake protein YcgR
MSDERRNAYRVAVEDAEIRAEVISESGPAVGEVLDLSLQGATIRIPLDQQPNFFVGETITLRLESKRMKPVQIIATVQSRTEQDRSRRFGIAFANPAVLHAKLSTGLLRFFNERSAFRVEPSMTLPVTLEAADQMNEGGAFVTTGHLRDISADGIGVVIEGQAERALAHVVQTAIEFTLPGDVRPLSLRATIRHRSQLNADGAVYIGLLFDPETSPNFVSQRRHITEYVTTLQGDLLQQLVGA